VNVYQVGDLVRLSATFTNSIGAQTDPTTITCLVKLRYVIGAQTTTYTHPATITKDSTGIYHVDITPDAEGIWDYRWVATGTVQAAAESAFNVPNSEFF
jgi:hypothetical protein